MFLAGAYQDKGNERPELRAPSVRGLLHWWFRAVAGGYLADHAVVRQREQRLFGGAGDATGGTASAISVRVRATLRPSDIKPKPPVPHKGFTFQCIKPDTPFTVSLSGSPYNPQPTALEAAEAVLTLAATLGGLGRRSRRGFGAFQPLSWAFDGRATVEEHVRQAIRTAQEKVKAFVGATGARPLAPTTVAPYPILHDAVATVDVGAPTDWEPFIADLMWEIHTRKDAGYMPAPDRLYPKVLGSGTPRQASTLLVSVVRINSGQVVPLYTQFYCRTAGSPGRSDFAAIEKLPGAVRPPVTSIAFPAP